MTKDDIYEVFHKPNELKELKVNPYKFHRTPEEKIQQAKIMLSQAKKLFNNKNFNFTKVMLLKQVRLWAPQAGHLPERIKEMIDYINTKNNDDILP